MPVSPHAWALTPSRHVEIGTFCVRRRIAEQPENRFGNFLRPSGAAQRRRASKALRAIGLTPLAWISVSDMQLPSRRLACFAKNFAGQKIQWSQTLDVSEQGFFALRISAQSRSSAK
jgi:hypothetical protein